MSNADSIILCSHIRRSFSDGLQLIEVLKDVNLSVSKGEFISIVGPSGSGKTTLLHIIACLDQPTSGEVFIEGIPISKLNDDKLSELRRNKIGMVFQDFYLLPALSALENVEVPMIFNNIPKEEREKRVHELLDLVGLSNRAHHKPGELSSGEKQRVQIARALANNPSIILADEPTGNLDTKTGKRIVNLLRDIAENQGKAVLMVTHDVEVAAQTHRTLLLKNGVIHKQVGGKF